MELDINILISSALSCVFSAGGVWAAIKTDIKWLVREVNDLRDQVKEQRKNCKC